MTIKSMIRWLALKTNPWWPFSVLNRQPYWLAILCFRKTCATFPEVRTVYLRHELKNGQWTPALSDIDLSVIVDGELAPEDEVSFLSRFWSRIGWLQSLFPMIGEIEVLSAAHLDSWRKFGLEGQNIPDWRRLAGEEVRSGQYEPDRIRNRRETFNYAFWFYLINVTDLYRQSSSPAFVRLQDLHRLNNKIGKCLVSIGIELDGVAGSLPADQTENGVLINMIIKLDDGLAVLDIPYQQNTAGDAGTHRSPSQATESQYRPASTQASDPGLKSFTNEIQSVYLDYRDQAFVILHQDALNSVCDQSIDQIRDHFRQRDIAAVFLNNALFTYMLHYLNPYDYSWFVKQASHVQGENLLTDIGPPPVTALKLDLLKHTSKLMTSPRSREFVRPGWRDQFRPDDVELTLDRALALCAYLRTGELMSTIDAMVRAYGRSHPDQVAEIAALRDRLNDPPVAFPVLAWFRLMNQLQDSVHEALHQDDRWESVGQEQDLKGPQVEVPPEVKPILSVIVPVFNGEQFLAEALDSIIDQHRTDMEIIVVDDGSTDGSAVIAHDYGQRLHYVYQDNNGPASARNTGLEMAHGSLLAFLDADDLWPPGKLAQAFAEFESDPAIDVVMGLSRFLKLRDGNDGPEQFEETLAPRVFLQLGCAVFRRSVFEKVGHFDADLQYSEDIDWFLRAREKGVVMKVLQEITLIHRLHGHNTTGSVGRDQLQITQVLKRSLDRRRANHNKKDNDNPEGAL